MRESSTSSLDSIRAEQPARLRARLPQGPRGSGFWSAFGGAEELGALVISGGAMTTEQRVRTMVELGATVVCCTPTYALRMAEVAREIGVDLAGSPLRIAVHAGEPGASIPATRDAIEAALGVRCFDHTGMTELGPTG